MRAIDENWNPSPSLYATGAEGEIAKLESEAREAQNYLRTLRAGGMGSPSDSTDLQDFEASSGGGHAIERHVEKTYEYLAGRTLPPINADPASTDPRPRGSFVSLESGNALVDGIIKDNKPLMDAVISGQFPRVELDKEFDNPTGYETYLEPGQSTPVVRPTYGVRVVIIPAPFSAKGFSVITAFPMNSKVAKFLARLARSLSFLEILQ